MIDIYVPLMLECLNEHAIYSIFSFKNRYFFIKYVVNIKCMQSLIYCQFLITISLHLYF